MANSELPHPDIAGCQGHWWRVERCIPSWHIGHEVSCAQLMRVGEAMLSQASTALLGLPQRVLGRRRSYLCIADLLSINNRREI